MIKGCQKKIIHLKKTDSPYFEEAYFILKDTPDRAGAFCENDMVREAIRLTESYSEYKKRARKKKLRTTVAVLAFFAAQALICGLALILAAFLL
ncbi:MAG: hypothetical protein IJD22_06715 [Clostridia bacterium]|nr:hypothetical protein [Clostridia bacterium]